MVVSGAMRPFQSLADSAFAATIQIIDSVTDGAFMKALRNLFPGMRRPPLVTGENKEEDESWLHVFPMNRQVFEFISETNRRSIQGRKGVFESIWVFENRLHVNHDIPEAVEKVHDFAGFCRGFRPPLRRQNRRTGSIRHRMLLKTGAIIRLETASSPIPFSKQGALVIHFLEQPVSVRFAVIGLAEERKGAMAGSIDEVDNVPVPKHKFLDRSQLLRAAGSASKQQSIEDAVTHAGFNECSVPNGDVRDSYPQRFRATAEVFHCSDFKLDRLEENLSVIGNFLIGEAEETIPLIQGTPKELEPSLVRVPRLKNRPASSSIS
jgi:hypothetical protein